MTESIIKAITFWNKTPCLSPLPAPHPQIKNTDTNTHHRICIPFLQAKPVCLLNIKKDTEL